jgi:hypothetical protein
MKRQVKTAIATRVVTATQTTSEPSNFVLTELDKQFLVLAGECTNPHECEIQLGQFEELYHPK